MTRIGVIGCGWASRVLHKEGIRKCGAFVLAGASDPYEKARKSMGAERVWPDWRQMLDEVECEAVLIASPPDEHEEAVLRALESGRHVLVEKPLAANLAAGERLAAAAEASGLVLAVGFNQRCHPAFRGLREQIARGEMGKLLSLDVAWSSGAGLGAREWLGVRARGGGALMDLGSHAIDLFRFLCGDEIEHASAESRSRLIDDESAVLTARTRGGAALTARLSLVAEDRYEVRAVFERGSYRLAPYGGGFRRSYVDQWKAFAGALQGKGKPAASAADGLESLRWITRAVEGLPSAAHAPAPEAIYPLSVISSTTLGFEAIRTTVAHLRKQSIASSIELVLVGPTTQSLEASGDELRGFAAVTRVAAGPIRSIAHGNAAGVRAARGRIVALTEDHCFPEPGWAEALLRAHEQECAVAGPVVSNANPHTLVSEADFVIGYGPWMAPMDACEMPFLPGHNSSYRRDDLLALGGRLERLMEAETVLHMEWSAQGRRLRVEPQARTRHVNYSLWSSWIPVQLLAGRLFGGMRSASWTRGRRLFYAAASPLIPAVRFWRCMREFFKPGRSRWRLVRVAPALAFGLVLDGIGQFHGYLLGAGDSMERLSRYEFNRIDHVRREERRLWTSP